MKRLSRTREKMKGKRQCRKSEQSGRESERKKEREEG